jgi:predicted lysophospholipase L1 biosynthesis ABC-type transport system permease subunit
VVGVIGDVRHDGLSQPAPQVVAVPVVDNPVSVFVVRSRRVGTPGFLQDVRRAMWAVDPDLATADVRTMGDLYRRSMARTSLALELLAITGTMALLLGAIGTYGIVGYAVSQRRREIGIRMALGAATGDVRLLFVRRALVLAGIGVAVGAIAGAGLAPLMRSQIFGVSSLDPITHAAVALSLLSAAGLASYVSARRASSLNPVEVLKGE